MAQVNWSQLKEGDFFTAKIDQDHLLYQKIREINGYNSILLNNGQLCCLYIPEGNDKAFEKVEVTFSFKPTE
jgi:hypothetical protein